MPEKCAKLENFVIFRKKVGKVDNEILEKCIIKLLKSV